jgi:hypothetical protein
VQGVRHIAFARPRRPIRIVATLEELRVACNNQNSLMLAGAYPRPKSCIVVMVEDEVMRKRGWTTGLLPVSVKIVN